MPEVMEMEQEMELEAEAPKKGRKKRLLLSKENKYLFATGDEAKIGLAGLQYVDGSPVLGYRVFTVGSPEDDDETVYILARTREAASWAFLEDLGYAIDLTFKMARGAPGRARKIDPFYIPFGNLLAQMIFIDPAHPGNSEFKKDAEPGYVDQWTKTFGVDGPCSHYFETDGSFKSPPAKKE